MLSLLSAILLTGRSALVELSAVGLCFPHEEKHAYLCKDVVTGALLQGHRPNLAREVCTFIRQNIFIIDSRRALLIVRSLVAHAQLNRVHHHRCQQSPTIRHHKHRCSKVIDIIGISVVGHAHRRRFCHGHHLS